MREGRRDGRSLERWLFRVGSFDVLLGSVSPRYPELLVESLGVPLFPIEDLEGEPDARLVIRERAGLFDAIEVPPDGLVIRTDGATKLILTELVTVALREEGAHRRIELDVRRPDAGDLELAVHLSVILHKVLFLSNRLLLHAAAVRMSGRVALFVGDKGAGKTTLSLAVARSGGTILAEDHVLVRRHDPRFLVSGCDQRARLTAATERHFFPEAVEGPFRDLGGVRKRELRVADHFDSSPFVDHPLERLCFVRVGERFTVARIRAARAVALLLGGTRKLQRFADPADQGRFLDYLTAFAGSVPGFEVELSPDLNDLRRLVDFLRVRPEGREPETVVRDPARPRRDPA